MATNAEKSDPKLWETVKERVTQGDKGGKAGQWSARKAQMAVQAYKADGGTYKGRKRADNHLHQWTEEAWGTKSGHTSAETGERYLPKAARDNLTADEYRRTTAKKRRDSEAGHQFSAQPSSIAKKTAQYRHHDNAAGSRSKADLYAEAKRQNVKGRSSMSKAQLAAALD